MGNNLPEMNRTGLILILVGLVLLAAGAHTAGVIVAAIGLGLVIFK